MNQILFPFADYWHFYALFIGFVFLLLALDLGVFHRKAHAVSMKEASIWSVVWISLALVFNAFLYWYALETFQTDARYLAISGFDPGENARRISLEFLTGFVVEKSLAVDNLFVFVAIFTYFGIPPAYQHRVLFLGIVGALIFRSIFIAIGSVLMQYHTVVLIFGAFLLITGIKLFFAPDKPKDLGENLILRILRRWLPVSKELHGQRMFVRQSGRLMVTPLFVTLVLVEFSDIIFAVDSVPAIFALTNEPLIVFTSNIFAILGLRSLYFLLAGVYDRFYMLKYGLGLVLTFVGLKMVYLNDLFGGKFPVGISLAICAGAILGSVVLSLAFPRRPRTAAKAVDVQGN